MHRRYLLRVLLFVGLSTTSAPASSAQQAAPAQVFAKTQVVIPMRDGIRLNTEIYVPKVGTEPLPILFERSPYPFGADGDGFALALTYTRRWAGDGYIYVFQYTRGRYGSEGVFVQPERRTRGLFPHQQDARATDESTDAYDTIAWLLKNVPRNNARVGMLGVSYDAWLTVMATVDPHPALKAISPQGTPADVFDGDDWYHHGAFRLAPSFYFAAWMAADTMVPVHFGASDTYEWFLQAGPLSSMASKYGELSLPLWTTLLDHPSRDPYVRRLDLVPYLPKVVVPTLNVGGFWDAEDLAGPIKIYSRLESSDSSRINTLVMGPWRHGGWELGPRDSVAILLTGGNAPAAYFRDHVLRPWFDHFLKDDTLSRLPEALVYQTGANRWLSYDSWPPTSGVAPRRLYLRESGRLSFDAPAASMADTVDSYVSDPANPVPYTRRPIAGFWDNSTTSAGWKVEDQRFVSSRPDVLSWETEKLQSDITLTGTVAAHLFASTTGTDSDWIVKLIDVYPEDVPSTGATAGYQLMIADAVMRAKYHRDLARPEPIAPNKAIEYTLDLGTHNHRFLRGHRIMIQVQSTWFPLIDRNPQRFVNIPTARATDYQAATQRIFRSTTRTSHVVLTVAP